MPVVIAIESDRHQAAQLSQIVRQRVGAELVLAATLDDALTALRSRVPDLILIPALMSAKEDAALTEALRAVSGPFPVPVLITPTFAVTRHSFVSGAMWPWSKRETPATEDGCDPGAFAEQLTTYLAQAADRPSNGAAVWSSTSAAPPETSSTTKDDIHEAVAGQEEDAGPPTFSEYADPPATPEFALIDERLAAIDDDRVDAPIPACAHEAPNESAVYAAPASFAAESDTRWTDASVEERSTPTIPAADNMPAICPDDLEWERLVASFRTAVEGLQVETWLGRPPHRNEPVRPVHDDWGIYDPEQCAMPAVMRRLQELETARGTGHGGRRK